MHCSFRWKLLFCMVCLAMAAPPAWAAGQTCSGRRQACESYCGKGPNCRETCKTAHGNCMSTGCWENVGVPKQCGFAKQ